MLLSGLGFLLELEFSVPSNLDQVIYAHGLSLISWAS